MLTPAPTTGDTSWFVHDRFGMFIHWGTTPRRHGMNGSGAAKRLTTPRIRSTSTTSIPTFTIPRNGQRSRAEAGMKYVVVTSKHHEGFCLWDSKLTDYKPPIHPASKTCYALWSRPSGRGPARRLLLLAHRLASPAVFRLISTTPCAIGPMR